MRWVAVVLPLVLACTEEPQKTKPRRSSATTQDAGSATSTAGAPVEKGAPGDAGGPVDAQLWGGNGAPAYRDDNGRVHGPGGPVWLGRGPECTDKINHCLRDGVWFGVDNLVKDKLYRATPVYELEGKWWTFREWEAEPRIVLRTKVVEHPGELKAGNPVVWLIEENVRRQWLVSEYDALTSPRWEVGVIKSVGTETFKVYGWYKAIPINMARVVIEQKSL